MTTQWSKRYTDEFKAFYKAMPVEDQNEVKKLIDQIVAAPELGDPVKSWKCEPGRKYQKNYDINKRRWPQGLRIVYEIYKDDVIILFVDMGDHKTSAGHPGKSVYPDER